MAFIGSVKKDIDFYKMLSSIMGVLKGIAISQFHTQEKTANFFENFDQALDQFLGRMRLNEINHPFIKPDNKTLGILAITSDAGLLGGLNMHVMDQAFKEMDKYQTKLMVVGERGRTHARDKKVEHVAFDGISDENKFKLTLNIRNHIVKEILDGSFGSVLVIYPHCYSLFNQKIIRALILPYGVDQEKNVNYLSLDDFIVESSINGVVEYLIFMYITKKINDILNISKLAEFGARFVHLDECTAKLGDEDKKLKGKYFRLRHELSDASMRELSASRLTRRKA